MPSTDTNVSLPDQPPEPSLIDKAMSMSPVEKAALKSARIQQATAAVLASDAAAGLAENRRSVSEYNRQSDRAVKHMVDRYVGNGANVPSEEDTVNMDLGDRYQEIRHYHGSQGGGIGRMAKAVAPWLLAAAMGPVGAGIAAWLLRDRSEPAPAVNVKDVQSKFKVEVYDEKGNLLLTKPYDELPK